MSKLNNQKGFTLIELVIVISILGIIALIAVPRLSGLVESSRISADQATVRILNSITPIYRVSNTSSDPFEDETKSDVELIEVLVDDGYLTSFVEPQSKDATLSWMFDKEKWYLMFPDSFYVISMDDVTSMCSNNMLGYWSGGVIYTGSSKDIVIPTSLNEIIIKEIGQRAFYNTGLIAVNFEEGSQLKRIHNKAFYCNNLADIVLPDSVERIDLWAFRNNNLTEIKLPTNLNTIEEKAFSENNLNKITIGSNVNHIGQAAFGDYTDEFMQAYNSGGAGTYILNGENWVKQGN